MGTPLTSDLVDRFGTSRSAVCRELNRGCAMTFEDSGYSMGEADALLGPLLGVDPADLIEWTLIAFTDDDEGGSMLRVGSSAEGNPEILRMLGTAIAQIADDLTEEELPTPCSMPRSSGFVTNSA